MVKNAFVDTVTLPWYLCNLQCTLLLSGNKQSVTTAADTQQPKQPYDRICKTYATLKHGKPNNKYVASSTQRKITRFIAHHKKMDMHVTPTIIGALCP
jgi:hypothetical protein